MQVTGGHMNRRGLFGAGVLVWAAAMVGAGEKDARVLTYPNGAGLATTYNAAGAIDLNNAFFQDLGSNKRTCASCHQPDSAWSITPANVERRFLKTLGGDAIFRNNDGSNCEGAIATTVAEKRAAYSL